MPTPLGMRALLRVGVAHAGCVARSLSGNVPVAGQCVGPAQGPGVRGGVKPPARLCWKGHMDAVNAGVEAHTLPYLFRKGRRPKL